MALPNSLEDSPKELLEAQTLVWNLTLNYINSMSLKCALQLGIPDVIHKHGKPITLSQLADALPINKEKSDGLRRLMPILVHSKLFDKVKISDRDDGDDEEAYSLTRASRLLMRNEPLSFAPFVLAMNDPIITDPFHLLMDWLQDEKGSPFVTKNGRDFWEFTGDDMEWNQVFNEAMASDARFVSTLVVKQCKHVFEGLNHMVDVGGGTGSMVKAVSDAFSGLKCTVLDLPHVVAGLEGSENLRFVSGDMFESIPRADAVLLKWMLHCWSDEECVKILEKCKEAITPNSGKVIILEMVVDGEKQEEKANQTKLCFEMLLMGLVAGKERTEKEWANLFSAAGFKDYKITPILGLRSVIEVFP